MVGAKRKLFMEVRYIKHAECSFNLLQKIGSLKKQYWNYPIKNQIEWLNNNIRTEDTHLCLLEKGKLIAYTTIVQVVYKLNDGKDRNALGIGSVCVDKSFINKQFGFLIVQLATFYIRQQSVLGLLLCKKELVSFYEKCNWIKYDGNLFIEGFDEKCSLLSTLPVDSNIIALKCSF